MTHWTLIRRSLRFRARQHFGVLLGAAVGSAVLIGALLVGDSVRESLREMALVRLGKTDLALASGDRLFQTRLAYTLSANTRDLFGNKTTVVPALMLPATATANDGESRANGVQILGVDESFWKLANQPPSFAIIPADGVVLNEALAAQLKVKPGASVLLRVSKPSSLSRDAPMSPSDQSSVALRLTVHAVASDAALGRFSLQANQVSSLNAFVLLSRLQMAADATNKANLLLAARNELSKQQSAELYKDLNYLKATLDRRMKESWELADAELELRELPATGEFELRTSRVFLDTPVIEAAQKAAQTNSAIANLIQTYFVNELRAGERVTPYSMVSAVGGTLSHDDEILLNQWLADELQAKPGDAVSLRYFTVGVGHTLEERTNTFRVRAVVPMTLPWADPELMPEFPGVSKAESTSEWDGSLPIDMSRIRPPDEEYWKKWRGTPKAFVTSATGEKMWGNRFGNFTAVRFLLNRSWSFSADRKWMVVDPPSSQSSNNLPLAVSARESIQKTAWPEAVSGMGPRPPATKSEIEAAILAHLDPASIGLRFEPVREQALKAAEQSQDFGGLFIGFSFFLIVAALLLTALLFQFSIEQRATEVGTLLALGFTPGQVRRMLLFEGAALSVLGALLGLAGGIAYARAMIHGLTTIWRNAVGTSSLAFHATPATLGIGVAASVAVALFTIWLALRKQARQPARALLAGDLECGDSSPLSPPGRLVGPAESRVGGLQNGGSVQFDGDKSPAKSGDESPHSTGGVRKSRANLSVTVALASLVLALALAGWAVAKGDTSNAGIFFGAGALLLIAALAATAARLTKLNFSSAAARLSLSGMAARNTARRRTRSLATVAMLACGSFLVASIGVFRLDENQNSTKRNSGTGGFAFIGESTLPVHHDLNAKAGREFFSLDDKALTGVSVVPFRVRDGDDASCLNLNRAQKPRLLGVKPSSLNGRFSFAAFAGETSLEKEFYWQILQRELLPLKSRFALASNEVPAIADEASILWALGKKIGDTLDYTDERGRVFKVRLVGALANSVLQGNLIIDEAEFVKRFPGESGYRMFLVDAPANRLDDTSATLTRALRDVGLELTPATRRLAQFNAVQNTYLSTFQVLGGLGLILGSVGLGVVVLRNVLERRGELALLLAVGFQPRALARLVLGEHAALLLLGLASGVVAATVAVVPAVISPNAEVPYLSLGLTLGGVLASGLVWTWLATKAALRGNLLEALRSE
ncbi:MAG: ABC transporter permease [Verrucomicrobia bacterium]|nr:ABC transporter permease [Verrucomicrobiota bacterium]